MIYAKIKTDSLSLEGFTGMTYMGAILLENIKIAGRGDEEYDILVEGGRISRISDAGAVPPSAGASDMGGPETVRCKGKVAVPGFVNMHTHAAMSLVRGAGEDMAFHQWLDRIWSIEKNIDEEFVYWGTKVACIEMLRTGTTTFNDHYWFPEAAYRAASESGFRPVVSHVLLDRNDRSVTDAEKDECVRLCEQARSWQGEVLFIVGIHSIYSVSEELMSWASAFARKHGLKLHIHLSETSKEVDDCIAKHGLTPVQYADRLGLLGPDTIAAHTLWLSEKDIEILGDRQVSCVHNINSNLKLSSGYRFLYNELKAAGANICIGTDGCASSNNLDILEALKTAAIVQKAWRGDPAAMPLDDLLSISTVNGARALGLDTGKIEEGKAADILIVDTDNTFFLSSAPFLANFIYSAHSDCIESVIIGGRFVMRDRKIQGEKEILREARKILLKTNNR